LEDISRILSAAAFILVPSLSARIDNAIFADLLLPFA
jgi:hypothetical protein